MIPWEAVTALTPEIWNQERSTKYLTPETRPPPRSRSPSRGRRPVEDAIAALDAKIDTLDEKIDTLIQLDLKSGIERWNAW